MVVSLVSSFYFRLKAAGSTIDSRLADAAHTHQGVDQWKSIVFL